MVDEQLCEGLDRLANLAFEREPGASWLGETLARWDQEVAPVRGDDPELEQFAAMRADWALCDVAGPGGMSWCAQLAGGDSSSAALAQRLSRSVVGLFEVWPGRRPWLRDRVGGLCLRLSTPLDLVPEPAGPAALWELRVVIEGGLAVAVRPPVTYPLALLKSRPWARPVGPSSPTESLQALRRARLWWGRNPRQDPRVAFAAVLGSGHGANPLQTRS